MQNVKYFLKDYRLPTSATVVYVVVLLVFLGLRIHDQSKLAAVLSSKNSSTGDYGTLLSKDKNDAFNKNSTASIEAAKETTTASASTPKTFTVSSSGTTTTSTQVTASPAPGGTTAPPPATTPPAGGGNTEPTPPPENNDPPPPTPPPTQPLTATVVGLRFMGASGVICDTTNGPSSCYKKYYFGGDIATKNGPGEVSYLWQYSVGAQHPGNFIAPTGDANTGLSDVLEISCNTPAGPVTMKLGVTSPTPNHKTFSFPHDCSTTPPPTGP